MKTAIVLVISFAALMFTSSVAAQGVDDTVVVTVPFEFIAGDEVMPAGTYRIRVLPDDTAFTGIIVLQKSEDGGENDEMTFQTVRTSTVGVEDAGRMEKPELSFTRVGGHYFLESVTTE